MAANTSPDGDWYYRYIGTGDGLEPSITSHLVDPSSEDGPHYSMCGIGPTNWEHETQEVFEPNQCLDCRMVATAQAASVMAEVDAMVD